MLLCALAIYLPPISNFPITLWQFRWVGVVLPTKPIRSLEHFWSTRQSASNKSPVSNHIYVILLRTACRGQVASRWRPTAWVPVRYSW